MRTTLTISALGHMAVIAWASFNFASVDPFEVEPIKALPVEFIKASELTRLKAGERKAKPSEEPAAAKKAESENAGKAEKAPKKEQVASLPPPPPPQPEPSKAAAPAAAPPRPKKSEAAPDTPKPEPVPAKKEEAKKEEPKKEEEKKEDKPLIAAKDVPAPAIRPRHQPSPEPKPAAKTEEKFDPDRIAALLNKAPEQTAPAQSRQVASLDSRSGDPRGLDERMSISEIDALRRQIQRCWSPPVGVRGASDLAVRLRLALNADGTLSRPPEVLTSGSGLGFLAAADSAKRAVLRCQPYDLPAGKFEAWRDINVNFDPREMLGG